MIGDGEATYPTFWQSVFFFLTRRDRRPSIEDLFPFDLESLYIHPMHKPLVESDEGLRWAVQRSRKRIVWTETASPWIYRTKWNWEEADEHWYRWKPAP